MLSRTRIKVLWSLAVFAIGVVSLVRSETVKHAFLDDSEHVHLSIEDQGDNADVESKSILGHKKWTYLSNDDINKFIFNIHIKYPNMTRFYSIGNSVQHKTMWVLVLSDSPMQRPLTRPMFKYTANIHGNEPLGRQLLVYLAEYLLQNYGKATRITRLLNSVEIHLLFSANPDGFTNAIEGDCSGNDSHLARNNSYQIDLDTDFPFSTSVRQHLPDMLANRQPETVSLMSWIVSNPFVLSGSLHSGIFLISYPFDYSRPGTHPPASVDNPTPDNDVFISLAAGFAESRKALQENSFCYDTQVTNITNGARFSQVTGRCFIFNSYFLIFLFNFIFFHQHQDPCKISTICSATVLN